ncbi:MAG: metallophosphoesterase family protein [Paracoccaceae bacterium]
MVLKIGANEMVSGFFGRLFGKPEFPAVAPDKGLFVIGDIHGRADLLERLLDKARPNEQVVCVGDYVDRGEHSADVLALLISRPDLICLRGNHEDMMLGFIRDPQTVGTQWLRHGGLQTIASYGVSGVSGLSSEKDLVTLRDHVVEAVGSQHLDWLNHLEYSYESGNVAVVHASADPELPIEDQSQRTLMWGHPKFLRTMRTDGIWVVHGHTIVDQANAENGRIAVDTGAYATGRLTAARIVPGSVEFIAA